MKNKLIGISTRASGTPESALAKTRVVFRKFERQQSKQMSDVLTNPFEVAHLLHAITIKTEKKGWECLTPMP